MKKNIAPFIAAVLLGFGVLLQTGCKKGAEPGTATNPKSEIFNIEYAIEKADAEVSKQTRMAMLRSAYDAVGMLNKRWPGDPAIESFLQESAEELGRIPETIYALSMEKSDRSPDVILQLSEILKYTLYETGQPSVDLEKGQKRV